MMTMIHSIPQTPDRVMAALVAGLEQEFGCPAGAALAERFLEAEECDFLWEARHSERWLGSYQDSDAVALELDRVAIVGRLKGAWFAAQCIVDGEGSPHGLIGRRRFANGSTAQRAFATMQ